MVASFFISYCRDEADKPFVDELLTWLDEKGFAYWFDQKIKATEDWRKAIDNQINASQGVILIATKLSSERPYVNHEWSYAMGAGKPIIVLVYEEGITIHPRITSDQYLKFYEDKEWDKLHDILNELAGKVQELPKAIQNAVNLFNSVDSEDWTKAVNLLKQSRSTFVNRAFSIGCEHDTYGVRKVCGEYLAEQLDERCVPIIIEIYEQLNITQQISLPYQPAIKKFKISEVESNFIEFIEYHDKHTTFMQVDRRDIVRETLIKTLVGTLSEIITDDGVQRLRGLSLSPGYFFRTPVEKLLAERNAN